MEFATANSMLFFYSAFRIPRSALEKRVRRRAAALLPGNVPCVGSRWWLLDAETADGRGEHGGLLQRTRRASNGHSTRQAGFTDWVGFWDSHGQRHVEESRGNDASERVGRAHCHHWLRGSTRPPNPVSVGDEGTGP